MVRWIFALIALATGAVAIKKETRTMRFPQTRFYASSKACATEVYESWFRELRRLACYPGEFSGREEGLFGPQSPPESRGP